MAAKKKPGAKKPTAKPEAIPGDVRHGRAADAAETQAVGVENLALAVEHIVDVARKAVDVHRNVAHGVEGHAQASDKLAEGFAKFVNRLCHPQIDGEPSLLERLVRAAERFAAAKDVEADALAKLALAHGRQATVDEAENVRRAELHVAELADRKARAEWRSRIAASRTGEELPPGSYAKAEAVPFPFPSQTYEGGAATPIVAVSTPAEPPAAPPTT